VRGRAKLALPFLFEGPVNTSWLSGAGPPPPENGNPGKPVIKETGLPGQTGAGDRVFLAYEDDSTQVPPKQGGARSTDFY
jgi:hypothetical protein